ncbi:hypothetical protein B2G71_01740 [Novosphingobium sp. PC22D]|uniref:DUF2271 domain-containing protein n=1 Tax=Novosphingobium sp. PC22D TaxID=1962403 RepID=UPI000BF0F4B1|nr:DUF2271 domain-containing protein [Novosphingobium sp. PC22D]PEQ14346.1 hypothetical protein B2G71_01740 [Novosphingobium sp. PC22D]
MRKTSFIAMTGAAAVSSPALADSMAIDITIPQLKVAEYHRPYVAVWLEPASGGAIRTLAVWYDHDMRGGEGAKWLSDMRTWWRKGGRSAKLDGVTGATKAPGPQKLTVPASALRGLAAGDYKLSIEAAREVGGREVVSVPVTLGSKSATTKRTAGKSELGAVAVSIKP